MAQSSIPDFNDAGDQHAGDVVEFLTAAKMAAMRGINMEQHPDCKSLTKKVSIQRHMFRATNIQ